MMDQNSMPINIACGLILSGCAFQRASIASRAQTELIGMSKKDLLMCAGVPVRQERVEDLEFLTFAGGGDSVGGAIATSTSTNTAVAVRKLHHRYCEVTFVLKDGMVQKVTYQDALGGVSQKASSVLSSLKTVLSNRSC